MTDIRETAEALHGTGYANSSHSDVAEWVYELSDAMLKERMK